MPLSKLLLQTIQGAGDSDPHAMVLFSLVLSLRAKNILELGVRDGNTTYPLLLGASYIPDAKVLSIDNTDNGYRPPNELGKYWDFHIKSSLEFLSALPETTKFDLVLVDDWHSYSHVKQELFYLDKHISPSSIVLVHDTMYGNTQPVYHTDLTLRDGQWAEGGPYRAIAELDPQFWEFSTIPCSHGLTLLRKKYSNRYFTK